MTTASFGTISHGTMRAEDLIPDFAWELKHLDKDSTYAELVKEAEAIEDYDSESAGYVLEELFDALNAFAPEYGYFGAHPGDGSDYGFWLYEDWEQIAKDDGVQFVADLPDAESVTNSDKVCVVNDHGNATLYVCVLDQDSKPILREVWSVV